MKKVLFILLNLLTITAMAQTKGSFEVHDLGNYRLHVYYTNDALGDASYIIEGKDALVTMEQPLFKDNVAEFDSYLSELGKPVEKRITDYHVGGTGKHDVVMAEGMPEFTKGEIYAPAAIDAEIAEAENSLASGATLFIGGHGGAAARDAVEFKIAYLIKMKELLAANETAQAFTDAMKQEGHTLYFATSPYKEVYRQLQENPNIELLAMDGNVSVRVTGHAVFDVSDDVAREIYADNPVLPRLYKQYTDLAYFRLPVAKSDYYDLTPTPPTFEHYEYSEQD